MKSFVHLHVHSYYSLLDGMSSIRDLVDKAQKMACLLLLLQTTVQCLA